MAFGGADFTAEEMMAILGHATTRTTGSYTKGALAKEHLQERVRTADTASGLGSGTVPRSSDPAEAGVT